MTIKPKHGDIRALLKARASKPEGATYLDFPELTHRQVLENARKMPDMFVVGVRHQARLFVDPEHAAHYEYVALPAIKHEIKRAKRRSDWLREKARLHALKPPKPPKPVKVKAEKPAKPRQPPKPPKAGRPITIGKQTKAGIAGVTIKNYTGMKWTPDTPAIVPPHVQVQYIPSPPAFGPAAKLLGIGS
jgi:hypothetical protein